MNDIIKLLTSKQSCQVSFAFRCRVDTINISATSSSYLQLTHSLRLNGCLYVALRQYVSQECTVVNFQNYDVFDAESVELLLER